MRACWIITKRELVGFFSSPIAPVFIIIFLLLAGFFTFLVGGFLARGGSNPCHPVFLAPMVIFVFGACCGDAHVGRGAQNGNLGVADDNARVAVATHSRQIPG